MPVDLSSGALIISYVVLISVPDITPSVATLGTEFFSFQDFLVVYFILLFYEIGFHLAQADPQLFSQPRITMNSLIIPSLPP